MKTLDQVEPRTPISALPFTISAPGSYYVTANLTGAAGSHGITIAAPDVSLDLNGFALIGVPGSLNGIEVTAAGVNRSIRNGTVRGWGGNGVNGMPTDPCILIAMRAIGNGGDGVRVGDRSQVQECISYGNAGAGLRGGSDVNLRVMLTFTNGDFGMVFEARAALRGSVARGNGNDGIKVGDRSKVVDCRSSANTGAGMRGAANVEIDASCAASNQGGGIVLGDGAVVNGTTTDANTGNGLMAGSGATIVASHARDNSNHGFYIDETGILPDDPETRDSAAERNGGDGFRATDGPEDGRSVRLVHCMFVGNGAFGASVAHGSTVRDCTFASNVIGGLQGGAKVAFDGNRVRSNGGIGINIGDGSRVRDCMITGSISNGLTVGANCSIADSAFNENGGVGAIVGDGSIVSNCTAGGNVLGGLQGGSKVSFNCNALMPNGGIGMTVGDGSTVRDCRITGSKSHGLSVGSKCSISCDAFSENGLTTGGDNLHVSGTGNQIRQNTATNPGGLNYNVPAQNEFVPESSAAAATSPFANLTY